MRAVGDRLHRHGRHRRKGRVGNYCTIDKCAEKTEDFENKQSAQQGCEVVAVTGAAREASIPFCCTLICRRDGRVSGATLRDR